MRILLVVATHKELLPWLSKIGRSSNQSYFTVSTDNYTVDVLVTGVGLMMTSINLTKQLSQESYDLLINVGIAGSFNYDLKLTELVEVSQDAYGDFGCELENNSFITAFQLTLDDPNRFPFYKEWILNPRTYTQLKSVKAISVQTITGTTKRANKLRAIYNADIESMEGIAMAYIAKTLKVNYVQVRAISNYVEDREKSKWRLQEAVDNLNNWLEIFLKNLSH